MLETGSRQVDELAVASQSLGARREQRPRDAVCQPILPHGAEILMPRSLTARRMVLRLNARHLFGAWLSWNLEPNRGRTRVKVTVGPHRYTEPDWSPAVIRTGKVRNRAILSVCRPAHLVAVAKCSPRPSQSASLPLRSRAEVRSRLGLNPEDLKLELSS